MFRTPILALALAVVASSLLPSGLLAQSEANYLPVGSRAPEVHFQGATRWGALAQPSRLSDFQGKAVVVAFFPGARTPGCTIQMRAYRDEYARVFGGGEHVVLVAVSNDPVEALESWARDEGFPFLLASDPDGELYRAFGGVPSATGRLGRTLVVLDQEGSVAELLPRFREVDPTAYDELQATLEQLATKE